MTPLILFGGSGDLARAKVLPALLRLRRDGVFPTGAPLVFLARRAIDPRALLEEAAGKAPDAVSCVGSLAADSRVVELSLGDTAAARAAAESLPPGAAASAALPPSTLPEVIATAAALRAEGRLARLAIEKPLGRHGEDAAAILNAARAALGESFFLVDHYAWKPAVRGFGDLARRGETALPAAADARAVRLDMRESIRVGRRAAFYDEVGATRDVFQSHGLLLLARAIAAISGSTCAEALASLAPTAGARARYAGYEEEGGTSRDAETAARLTLASSLLPGAPITVTFGKALPRPGVSLAIDGPAGEWRLSVQPSASLAAPGKETLAFAPPGEGYDAYEGALAAVLSGDFSGAPAPEESLAAWRVTDACLGMLRATPLIRHAPGEEPAW
jgi:glucose-6-phosphate 1-dehydrogenase